MNYTMIFSTIAEWWGNPTVQQCLPYVLLLSVYAHMFTSIADVESTLQRRIQRVESRVKALENTVDDMEEALQPSIESIDEKLDDLGDFIRNKVVLKKCKDV